MLAPVMVIVRQGTDARQLMGNARRKVLKVRPVVPTINATRVIASMVSVVMVDAVEPVWPAMERRLVRQPVPVQPFQMAKAPANAQISRRRLVVLMVHAMVREDVRAMIRVRSAWERNVQVALFTTLGYVMVQAYVNLRR